MTNNRIWAAVCFLLSIIISIMVVAHSFFFLEGILDYHWMIIALALSTVELAYITLPYIAKRNEGVIKHRYLAIIIALFCASVIPATLQTTKDFRLQLEEKVVSKPIEPIKSPLITTYQNQINNLDVQIGGNQGIIAVMISKNFVTKSAGLQTATGLLSEERRRLSMKQERLEQAYQQKKDVYDTRMVEVSVALQKQELNYWFDGIKLIWSLMVILILQLANAAFVHHGSQLLIRPDERSSKPAVPVKEKPDRNINTVEQGTLLTVNTFLENYKVSGLGPHKAEQFLNKFNINTVEKLKTFVMDDRTFTTIREDFSPETANLFNRMVRVVKRRMEKD